MTQQSIVEHGSELQPPSFLHFDLARASEEFEQEYAKGFQLSGYENVADLGLRDIKRLNVISGIFERIQTHIETSVSQTLKFEKLWLVKSEATNMRPDSVPFVPHIDKRRYVKAMVYLDDVEMKDGPFTAATCRPAEREALRLTFGPDYQERRQNIILDIPMSGFKPRTAAAGSVIFFDTNCPHFAGTVSGDGRRRVLRFDFEDPSWNLDPKPSLRRRIASKLFG